MPTHIYAALPYRPPLGLPMRWQDDVTGRLPRAMKAYLENRVNEAVLSQEDFNHVRSYMEYLINAPCWRQCENGRPLDRARRRIKRVQTPAELARWIHSLLSIGIDPI